MRAKVIYQVASSLDGFIATQNGGVDWLHDFARQEVKEEDVPADWAEFQNSFDGIVLGGRTYDVALKSGQWTSVDRPSWVFTGRELPILHPSIQLTQETPEDLVRDLDDRGFKRIWLMGGGKLAASFVNAGLIDSVLVSIMPIVLGKGIPLLGKLRLSAQLKLADSKQTSGGIVEVAYKV